MILHHDPKAPNSDIFTINISPCKDSNKRTGAKCASTDEIKTFINEVKVGVLSKEQRVDWEIRDHIPISNLFKPIF